MPRVLTDSELNVHADRKLSIVQSVRGLKIKSKTTNKTKLHLLVTPLSSIYANIMAQDDMACKRYYNNKNKVYIGVKVVQKFGMRFMRHKNLKCFQIKNKILLIKI